MRRRRRADCRTTASSPSCEPSSRTTSPPRSRSAPRPWSSGTRSASRPATVRNDMAALEEEGFITQPHTSAGRIPTDKGYRLFVDRLTTLKPMSAAEKRAIATFLDGAVDLDDVVHRSVRLLSQLTHQVAVVQYPTLSRSTVRHVELVALAPNRLLVVLILSTGRVEQRLVELDQAVTDDDARRRPRDRPPGRDGRDDRRRRRPRCRRARPGRATATHVGGGRPWSRRCPTTAPTSGSWSAAPPTWPGSATPSTSTYARCSRRSRSTSCCSSCSARPTRAASPVRIGHEGPYEELVVHERGRDRLRPR